MEIDAKKEAAPIVVQQEQPSASLPAEVTGITAASSATATSVAAAAASTSATTSSTPLSPFASMSFDVPSPHQRGEGFPFSPQSSSAPLTSSASLPTSPFTFSSPGAATQVPPALVFGAAPAPKTTTTPAAPAAMPLAKPAAPSLVQAAVAKRAPKREGKGKTRPAKSKEQVKEEMKMRSAIEEKVIEWTQDEKETMLRLPRKEYLLENEKATLLGLIDLVFAYAYNQRTTMDEPTCESDWTITNISPTLSWLETFGGIGHTLTACVRRSLVYPLYRHWGLAQTVMADVVTIFSMGKRSVLRALLGVKRILDRSDPRFYHCKLFVDDYCVWLQAYSNHRLRSLCGKIKEAVELFDKEDVEWPLDELEREAPEMVMDVEPDEEAPQHL